MKRFAAVSTTLVVLSGGISPAPADPELNSLGRRYWGGVQQLQNATREIENLEYPEMPEPRYERLMYRAENVRLLSRTQLLEKRLHDAMIASGNREVLRAKQSLLVWQIQMVDMKEVIRDTKSRLLRIGDETIERLHEIQMLPDTLSVGLCDGQEK